MKKTVFISSTFEDLKEERRQIWDTLESFNVVVKGMEQFGAQTKSSIETCLDQVQESDIYIGIIGMRYGSEYKQTGKSYTQLEYEKAIEKGLEILIYLIDDNYPVLKKYIQEDKVKELNSLKNILKEKHTVDTFANTSDLISKIGRRFKELLPTKDNVSFVDEYEKTIETLTSFFLFPGIYNGREIKLKIKFIGEPNPASFEICKYFNLDYGKTIVNQICISYPEISAENFTHIFIDYEKYHEFIKLDKNGEYEIYGNIFFKEKKIDRIMTNFKDRSQYFDPMDDYMNTDDWDPSVPIKISGSGQVILKLKDFVISK